MIRLASILLALLHLFDAASTGEPDMVTNGFSRRVAGNLLSLQHDPGPGLPLAVTTRAHNSLNQITGVTGGGATLVRGTLDEPGHVAIGHADLGDHPAKMLDETTFEAELDLPPGTNSITVTAQDPSGNKRVNTYQVQTAAVPDRDFSYDDDGNLLSDGIRTSEWDSRSRLTKITWASGGGFQPPSPTTSFTYNALGQRATRTDSDGTNTVTHHYLFDGINPVDRRSGPDSGPAPIDRRYFAEGEQRLEGTAWTTYHFCRDHLGSIREVVKSDSTLAARYDFDPYGKRGIEFQSPAYALGGPCDFAFTGHLMIASSVPGQTELSLAHFRAYDPALGGWLSPDPIGEAGGANLYAYVAGNPINARDPEGLSPLACPAAAKAWSDSQGASSANVTPGQAVGFMFGAVATEAVATALVFLAPEAFIAALRNPPALARAAAALDETGCAGAALATGAAAGAAKTLIGKDEIILAIVHDGKILAQTRNFMLSHAEFVRRYMKDGLPNGATVCTIGKDNNRLIALTSKTIHDKQTHVSEEAYQTIRSLFE